MGLSTKMRHSLICCQSLALHVALHRTAALALIWIFFSLQILAIIAALWLQMAQQGLLFLSTIFLLPPVAGGRGLNPCQSVELHRPGTFEGCSTE